MYYHNRRDIKTQHPVRFNSSNLRTPSSETSNAYEDDDPDPDNTEADSATVQADSAKDDQLEETLEETHPAGMSSPNEPQRLGPQRSGHTVKSTQVSHFKYYRFCVNICV